MSIHYLFEQNICIQLKKSTKNQIFFYGICLGSKWIKKGDLTATCWDTTAL